MAKLVNGLQQIGDKWYYIRKVPDKLKSRIGKSAIKRCLETDSHSTARLWRTKIDEKIKAIFKELKRPYSAYADYTTEDLQNLIYSELYKIVDEKRVLPILEGKYLKNVRNKTIGTLKKQYIDYCENVKKIAGSTIHVYKQGIEKIFIDEKMTLNDVTANFFKTRVKDIEKEDIQNSSLSIYLSKVVTFLNWIEDNDEGEFQKTVYKTISDLRDGLKTENVKDAFTKEQLKTIFSEDYSKTFKKSCKYFVYLLSYVCGLRLDEALSLKVKDVHEGSLSNSKKVFFLQVTQGKTEAAKRFVILPKIFLEKGFKDYYTKRCEKASPESCLWDASLTMHSASKAFTKYLVKTGIRNLDKNDIVNRKYTEHSLRHSNATKMKASGVLDDFAKKVFGHAGKDLMSDRYFIQQPELLDLYTQVTSRLDFTEELENLLPFGVHSVKEHLAIIRDRKKARLKKFLDTCTDNIEVSFAWLFDTHNSNQDELVNYMETSNEIENFSLDELLEYISEYDLDRLEALDCQFNMFSFHFYEGDGARLAIYKRAKQLMK